MMGMHFQAAYGQNTRMAASEEPARASLELELPLALGPLGHRINHSLGTARLAVDCARQIADASDRAEALAQPLADVARCIDEAGRVTKALQRLARVPTEPSGESISEGNAPRHELPDWNRVVRAAVALLPDTDRLEVHTASEPLPVAIAPNSWASLLAASFRLLLTRTGSVAARTEADSHAVRLLVACPRVAGGPSVQRWLDPFSADAAIESLDELALFVLRSVTLRHGGRLELEAEAETLRLTLELRVAQ